MQTSAEHSGALLQRELDAYITETVQLYRYSHYDVQPDEPFEFWTPPPDEHVRLQDFMKGARHIARMVDGFAGL